ncbi:MAG: imidazoleglycerol-phosphate dehydratase HisB [Planctomycetota bacterium]
MNRISKHARETKETSIQVELNLDGDAQVDIQTGLGFFDHMLTALAFHAGWGLILRADGDLHIDDHHTIEDCGLVLGQAFESALGTKTQITRFASRYAPLDEALARTVIDISGRPCAVIDLGLRREQLGEVASENLSHFLQSFATAGNFTLHVDVLRGTNDHHRAEAAFKATALALRDACRIQSSDIRQVPSTKGVL